MHLRFLLGAAAAALLLQASPPARAGLFATPSNTVNALFFLNGVLTETEDFGSPPVAGPAPIGPGPAGVDFVEGAGDLSTIHVGDTQITITDLAPPSLPFCSTLLPCADSFTGWEFQFSSGVDITGVSVDAASAADFLPVIGGLSFTPTDIRVNVTGDAPAINDKLMLDLAFTSTPPPAVPEPASLTLLAMGLAGIWAVGMRARRRRG